MAENPTRSLIGDGEGIYRVMVIGNSGTGKSTLSAALAKTLGVPHISLDRLNWKPGWKETPAEELKTRVREILDNSPQGWIADGNYTRKLGSFIQDNATDIIWLDPPLVLYFPRIFIRTMRRWLLWEDPCSPGCMENDLAGIFFSSKSILWWCISHHWVVRRRSWEMMGRIGVGVGSDVARRRMRRIGGWGGELKIWWQGIESLVQGKDL